MNSRIQLGLGAFVVIVMAVVFFFLAFSHPSYLAQRQMNAKFAKTVVAPDEKTGELLAAPVVPDASGKHHLAGLPKKIDN